MACSPRSGCTARTTLHLVGPQSWTAVPAALVYESADPYAVRVMFGDAGEDVVAADADPDDEGVEWLLSRELLRAGLSFPAGDGDVRIWPARAALDVLFLQLRAPSGEALFELSAAVVGDFLRETELLVPAGQESGLLQVDDELSALLQGGSDNPTAP
ncbi:Streptomyces sporulation and cell division protein, SsgA [Modestobacter sp. DSM 44400]|uniref:SsgA family sporulation/cell division regulator n=1 Tax=Modestobacter sp. DSM 44400 TaxID=1550230 RepID=UPI00089A0CA6|nr:SsgA family sporulation/cell division regulator [Modestobacter sp. DSM 44400]SDX62400.1 Streptomyces sporulation and cell division protein, SsgA [Modestobacter sp. DSM 44400]